MNIDTMTKEIPLGTGMKIILRVSCIIGVRQPMNTMILEKKRRAYVKEVM